MTLVSVMRDKFIRSSPQLTPEKPVRNTDRAYVLDLGTALDRAYTSDAHFTAYHTPTGHRLNYKSLDEGTAVELTAVVFDIDGTGHKATHEWRRAEREKVIALNTAHPGLYEYDTRGGYRIVYRQAEPTVLRTQADALEWSKVYSVAVAHLEHRFGIIADPACCDWQRLYRLPRATRDPGGKPENHPYWGDPHRIGTLVIQASWADVAKAQRDAARTFKAPREQALYQGSGDGLLFWALKLRGDVYREAPRGGWICKCPNSGQHTSNTDGADTTVVYPASDGQLGWLCCKHGHCCNLTIRDWLATFSDAELDAARDAAGLPKERAA